MTAITILDYAIERARLQRQLIETVKRLVWLNKEIDG